MSRSKIFRPGEICQQSGQYEIVNSDGSRTGIERTITKGEPFPPTPKHGQGYILVDKTKH